MTKNEALEILFIVVNSVDLNDYQKEFKKEVEEALDTLENYEFEE